MLLILTLKSSHTRKKRALIKEQGEAEELLQTDPSDNPQENLKLSLSIGKVLLNLETKLERLELLMISWRKRLSKMKTWKLPNSSKLH